MCGWRINKKLCPRIYCTFSKLYFGHKYTAHNSNQPSKNVRELYRLYRETFPVAPVSQALIIIFTTRTPSALLHSTPSYACVTVSKPTYTTARLLVTMDYVPVVMLLLRLYTRDVYFMFYVRFLMESGKMRKLKIGYSSIENSKFTRIIMIEIIGR